MERGESAEKKTKGSRTAETKPRTVHTLVHGEQKVRTQHCRVTQSCKNHNGPVTKLLCRQQWISHSRIHKPDAQLTATPYRFKSTSINGSRGQEGTHYGVSSHFWHHRRLC
jgi:hypothetical protein